MRDPDRWLDPPEERDAFCDCGHRASEHGDDNNPDTNSMQEALEKIIALVDKPHQGFIGNVEHLARRGLSICGGSEDCECHAFSESVDEPPDEE